MNRDGFSITVGHGDDRISAESLASTVQNALGILRIVESDLVAPELKVRWELVRATMKSPLVLTFRPANTTLRTGRRIIETVVRGFRELAAKPAMPKHFDEEALQSIKKLSAIAEIENTQIKVGGSRKKDSVELSDDTIRNIEVVVSRAPKYMDYSTIEGRLEVISVRDDKPSVNVCEDLSGFKVECQLREELLEYIQDKRLLGRRVSVTGRIAYRNHIPKQIRVESIQRLPAKEDLPQLNDIGSVDITNGLSSEEFVRRIRNGTA